MPRSSSRKIAAASSFMRLWLGRLHTSGAPSTPPRTLGQLPRPENLLVRRRRAAPALLLQEAVLEQIADAVAPGLVRVATDVDAAGEHRRAGRDIADPHIDVEDQVTDLLHPADQGKLGAQPLGDADLAAVAAPQHAGRGDLRVGGRNVDQLEAARCLEAL